MAERLIITVDVECDSDGGPTWRYADPAAFRGISHGVADRLHQILESTGSVATLLISNVVLEDQKSVAILKSLPNVELGAHLHGDFLPPFQRYTSASGAKTVENQCEYPEEVEVEKLRGLGRLFDDAFGFAPTSFRAGRWSASARTIRLLEHLGYVVDSSVTPGVHWTDGGRSIDFRRAPTQPYHPDRNQLTREGESKLWEFPVSIVRPWRRARHPLWLRPSLATTNQMQTVIRLLRKKHAPPRTFVLMFHNNELTPRASPYSRDEESAQRVQERLASFLRWAASEGMQSCTLTEAARACESS